MVVIVFSWNKSKAETKQFPCYNPTLETTTHQQRVTHKHHEPRIWCLLLQVCLHRKNNLCFGVRLVTTLPVQMREKWLSPEVWPMADRQPLSHQVLSLGSRAEQDTEPWQITVGNCSNAICEREIIIVERWCASTVIHTCIGGLE